MDRRKFLGAGAATLAALAAPKLARGASCDNQTQTDKYGLGPFYTKGAPKRSVLAGAWEPGQRILIQGKVTNCAAPVTEVNLDLWHATTTGCYKHPNDTCPDFPGHPDDFRLRGQVLTDSYGNYSFETILPGAYLNGDKYRPRHVHCIISHPTMKSTIVTQLYFAGDEYIKGDYAADDPSAVNRIIPLTHSDQNPWTGTWNIRIPGSTITGLDPMSDPAIAEFDVVTERRGSYMYFQLPPNRGNQPVEMRVYTAAGVLVKRSLHRQLPVELDVSLLSRGAYVAELGWWTLNGMRTESVPFHI
jgi:protocatechuate 3,4-dioxygenase beta subunit